MIFCEQVGAPARVGLVAPIDVVVPPGNTGLDPSQTSFFQVYGLLFDWTAVELSVNVVSLGFCFFYLTIPILYRCLTFPPRLTRVLLKLSHLWSLLGRVTRWDLLRQPCLQSLGLDPSLMVLLSSLSMKTVPSTAQRSLTCLKMT